MSKTLRNGASRGPATAEQAANIIRKVDRLLVLAHQSAQRQARILKLLEKKPAKRRGVA